MRLLRLCAAVGLLLGLLIAALLGVQVWRSMASPWPSAMNGGHQAVLLSNGQVYFGIVERASRDHLVLTEVYYVQSRVDQETKEVANALIRRGQELHGPERMVVNAAHVIFIEPVGPQSQVARLIAQSQAAR